MTAMAKKSDTTNDNVDYESTAIERPSYITAILHFYRGEVARANTWRLRLDQTTNWSVLTTASVLGFAFGDVHASHFSLLFANIFLVILLGLEARRFRFFDVWRARIRMIEKNFFAPILRREPHSPEIDWGLLVADDLSTPHFHLNALQAVRQRLARNYVPIFLVVLVAWVIKVTIHPTGVSTFAEIQDRCSLGPISGSVVIGGVALFYGLLLGIMIFGQPNRPRKNPWGIGEIVQDEI